MSSPPPQSNLIANATAVQIINYLIDVSLRGTYNFEHSVDRLETSNRTPFLMELQPIRPPAYVPPSVPVPALPAPPPGTVIDPSGMMTALNELINTLSGSWMKRYFPDEKYLNDVALPKLIDGKYNIGNEIDEIESELKAALQAAMDKVRTELEKAIEDAKNLLNGSTAGLQPKIDAALDRVGDDSAEIAWARARDQAAREAMRSELEAVSDWAGRGWSMPSGVLTAQAALARQATINASSAMAAEQAVRMSEQYFKIAMLSIESWIKVVELQINSMFELFKSGEGLRIKAAEMELQAYREVANVAMEGIKIETDFVKVAGSVASQYRLGVKNALNGLMSAYAGTAGTGLSNKDKIAESQRDLVRTLAAYWGTAISEAQLKQTGTVSNRQQDINWSNEAAQHMLATVANNIKVAHSMSGLYSQISASALSGLNGIGAVASTEVKS